MYFYPYTYTRRLGSAVINVRNVINRDGGVVPHVYHVSHATSVFVRVVAVAVAAALSRQSTGPLSKITGSFLATPVTGNSHPDDAPVAIFFNS